MFSVEPWGFRSTKEELRSIGIWAGVRHRQSSWTHVIQLEVFVGKASPVDGLAACPVPVRKITSLDNFVINFSTIHRFGPGP